MGKSKTKILILIFSVLLFIFITAGCSRVLKQLVYNQRDDSYKNSVYESAKAANLKGVNLVESNEVENGLKYFEDALDYAKEYQELEYVGESDVSGELLSDAYNNLCWAYYLLSQFELSLEYGDLAVEILPNDSAEYNNRGNAYYGLGKYNEAMADYDKALEIDNEYSYAHFGKGLIHYNYEEYEKSLKEFENCLQNRPDDIDAYHYIIWCHYNMGSYDEGIEVADKALSIDKNNLDIYDAKGYNIMAKSGFKEAETYYKSIANNFNDRIEAQLLVGIHYYNNYDYMAALEYFSIIKDKFASNTDLNCWIISCYTALGYMDEADSFFQEVLEAGDATIEFCNHIGNMFTDQGYYIESIKYYDQAINMDKKDRTAYSNKMYSLYYGKRYTRCINHGNEMIKIFKEDYDLIGYIAESHYNKSDYEEALHFYERALMLRPNDDLLLSYISDVYAILGDYENAASYADQAISKNRNNETAIAVKRTIENRQRPIEVQIEEFVRTNYLYYNVDKDIDQAFQTKNMTTNLDIAKALENVKKSDDIFTFCIMDEAFDYYYEYYMTNVEHQGYEYMDYIRIYDFNTNTDDQIIEILDSIEEPENRILAIDLRMNGGGDTLAASNILDALLPSCVTCTLIDKNGYTYNYYSDASQIKFKKIFILVDEYSASAAELLTLGLKTYLNNVTVIGVNTFGKGVGQLVYEDKNRKLLVFVVNHFWNVREQNIKETGISPDVELISDEVSDYLDV
ncbi:MAG: tetratricopeptide repeat protein, partial [Anaerolineaceae bacterium]